MLVITSAKEGGYVFSLVCLSVCLSVGLLANLWTDFDEIFWRGRAWLKDQVIQFWWRSGSRFGSRSPKSEIRILRIGGGLCSLSAFLVFVCVNLFVGPHVEHSGVCLLCVSGQLLSEIMTLTNRYLSCSFIMTLSGSGVKVKVVGQSSWPSCERMFFFRIQVCATKWDEQSWIRNYK